MKEALLRFVEEKRRVTYNDLTSFGDRRAVGVYLGLLVKEGKLLRTGRGVYEAASLVAPEWEVVFGFEIEAEYNGDLLHLHRSDYHEGGQFFCPGWWCERDGSLSPEKFNMTAEFVPAPTPLLETSTLLGEFKKSITARAAKTVELRDVLNFNSTTGAHVHIGLLHRGQGKEVLNVRGKRFVVPGKMEEMGVLVTLPFLKTVREAVKKGIRRELPAFYPGFNKAYYRRYAKRVTKPLGRSRYQEFTTETGYNTVEYRSLNLRGLQTWNDLFTFYRIVTEATQKTFTDELRKEQPFATPYECVVQGATERASQSIETLNIELPPEKYEGER